MSIFGLNKSCLCLDQEKPFLFKMATTKGTVISTADFKTFTAQQVLPTTVPATCIATGKYGDIMVAGGELIYTSTDGEVWTRSTGGLKNVIYTDCLYTSDGNPWLCTDKGHSVFLNWTQFICAPTGYNSRGLLGGLEVDSVLAFGTYYKNTLDRSALMRATTQTEAMRIFDSGPLIRDVAYDGASTIVCVGGVIPTPAPDPPSNTNIAVSYDKGSTWTGTALGLGSTIVSVCCMNGVFFALTDTGQYLWKGTLVNGAIKWVRTSLSTEIRIAWSKVRAVNGTIVLLAGTMPLNIAYSIDNAAVWEYVQIPIGGGVLNGSFITDICGYPALTEDEKVRPYAKVTFTFGGA